MIDMDRKTTDLCQMLKVCTHILRTICFAVPDNQAQSTVVCVDWKSIGCYVARSTNSTESRVYVQEPCQTTIKLEWFREIEGLIGI
jgi:hypothetical protein